MQSDPPYCLSLGKIKEEMFVLCKASFVYQTPIFEMSPHSFPLFIYTFFYFIFLNFKSHHEIGEKNGLCALPTHIYVDAVVVHKEVLMHI